MDRGSFIGKFCFGSQIAVISMCAMRNVRTVFSVAYQLIWQRTCRSNVSVVSLLEFESRGAREHITVRSILHFLGSQTVCSDME